MLDRVEYDASCVTAVFNLHLLFLLIRRLPPDSTLFPYTTLFRSQWPHAALIGSWCGRHREPRSVGRDHPRFGPARGRTEDDRSEEHTSELQSQSNLVCRLLLEKKKQTLLAARLNCLDLGPWQEQR